MLDLNSALSGGAQGGISNVIAQMMGGEEDKKKKDGTGMEVLKLLMSSGAMGPMGGALGSVLSKKF